MRTLGVEKMVVRFGVGSICRRGFGRRNCEGFPMILKLKPPPPFIDGGWSFIKGKFNERGEVVFKFDVD